MVHFHNVSKVMGGRPIIDKFSLSLESQKTHIFIGPSGCGKTTLLRMLVGIIEPSSGKVMVNENEMSLHSQKAMASQIGYVIQEGGLFPHLTARQNVTFASQMKKKNRIEMQKRVEELTELVGFRQDVLDRYPRQLSGGQRQRVSLMRALMLDPPLLVLDEPLGALDPIVRSALQVELKSIFNQLKKTVVIVTHDVAEAVFFGHTITLIRSGKILQHGTAEQLFRQPASEFVSEFLNAQKPPELMREFL